MAAARPDLGVNESHGSRIVLNNAIMADLSPGAFGFHALVHEGGHSLGLTLRLPKGLPIVTVNSLRYKDLFQDLLLVARQREEFEKKYRAVLNDRQRDELRRGLLAIHGRLIGQKGITVIQIALGKDDAVAEAAQASVLNVGDRFMQKFYSNVLSWDENAGHAFGAGLSEREKQALIAFVATL